MDPNANLAEQERIIVANRIGDVHIHVSQETKARYLDLRTALAEWLQKGGFEPDWEQAPNARKYYGR
jgi:hypothetical protein